ncbi:MAG: hypothetical protein AAF558_01855 [Verrucomicrobiota bacterium]
MKPILLINMAVFYLLTTFLSLASDPSQLMGGSIFATDSDAVLTDQLENLSAAGVSMTRVGANLADFLETSFSVDDPAPEKFDRAIDLCEDFGIKPMILLNFYQSWHTIDGKPSIDQIDWYQVGRQFAQRFGARIEVYSIINEPDLCLNTQTGAVNDSVNGRIPLTDYANAIEAFADGVHSVDSSYKVINGGFASQRFHGKFNCRGYAPALAPLFNDGTLHGLNLHNYCGDMNNNNCRPQRQFSETKRVSGITADIGYYSTEWNVDVDDASAMLTEMWAHMGVVGTSGDSGGSVTGFAFPYNINTLAPGAGGPNYGLALDLDPWVPDPRGEVIELVTDLTKDLAISKVETSNKGVIELEGAGKKMWVWQNRSNYSNIAGTSFTIQGIPSGISEIAVYRHSGLLNMVSTGGQSDLTVTNLPQDETLMFLADPNGSGGPTTGIWYHLRNKGHGGTRNLQALDSGAGWNVQTSTNTGWWTQWKLIDAESSYFFMLNRGHGETRNLRAANSGANWSVNTETTTGDWTRWRLIDLGGGYYNLRNKAHGGNRNLRAGNSGENWNVNTTTAALDWEKWKFVTVE